MPDKTPFSLGGQALVEGVMMRSPHYVAAAVRRTDGEIATRLEPFHSLVTRFRFLNLPLLRGVIGLFEMLGLGMRYLQWSGNLAMEEDESAKAASNPVKNAAADAADEGSTPPFVCEAAPTDAATVAALPWWMFLLTVTGSLGFGLLLFVALPNLVTDWTLRRATHDLVALNLFEGAVKLLIFVGYIWLIGQKADIRRIFEYHGAEHKVVYAAENGLPITPQSARPFDTPHPRCGTGFALLTVFVSILCFTLLPWPEEHWKRVGWRLLLMPLVAGVSYEIIKLTVHPQLSTLARIVMLPGMWLQRLTTRQPDDRQLEVSCAAMKLVITAEDTHLVQAKPGLV